MIVFSPVRFQGAREVARNLNMAAAIGAEQAGNADAQGTREGCGEWLLKNGRRTGLLTAVFASETPRAIITALTNATFWKTPDLESGRFAAFFYPPKTSPDAPPTDWNKAQEAMRSFFSECQIQLAQWMHRFPGAKLQQVATALNDCEGLATASLIQCRRETASRVPTPGKANIYYPNFHSKSQIQVRSAPGE